MSADGASVPLLSAAAVSSVAAEGAGAGAGAGAAKPVRAQPQTQAQRAAASASAAAGAPPGAAPSVYGAVDDPGIVGDLTEQEFQVALLSRLPPQAREPRRQQPRSIYRESVRYKGRTVILEVQADGFTGRLVDATAPLFYCHTRDMIGVTCAAWCGLCVVYTTERRKGTMRTVLVSYPFEFLSSELCEQWTHWLRLMAEARFGNPSAGLNPRSTARYQRILVLVNPFGGKRNAEAIFTEFVRPILEYAGCELRVLSTERPGHAVEIARAVPLKSFDVLCVVSGDGVLNEVVQGLMERPDWHLAIRKPLAIVPAGSGNGLACSLGCKHPVAAAHAIVKGRPMPLDLFSIKLEGEAQSRFGFLSLSWGLLADIDIESESMRALGSLRFLIKAVQLIMAQRYVTGTVRFIPEGVRLDPISIPSARTGRSIPSTTVVEAGDNSETEDAGAAASSAPAAAASVAVPAFRGRSLPPLTSPAWRVLQDEFCFFALSNVPDIGADTLVAPDCKINDGALHLVVIRRSPAATRCRLLQLLTKIEKGEHVKDDIVEVFRVQAVVLEPSLGRSHLVLDGEEVPLQACRLETLPGLARIMSFY